ncbi:MAG TPA: aldehyde dehydrogenase family protein, partial [Candidatus Limnocylindria bacterium]
WSSKPATKRGEHLFKAAELLESKLPQLGEEMTREEGKTLPEAIGEVTRAINIFRYFGGEGARQFTYSVPSERPQVLCYTIRKPLGTVALITPWNFPSAIPAWKLAPALVAGNTVVLKPASLAPLSSYRLVEALHETGIPKGVINYVTGGGGSVGDALTSHPGINGISFTGSTSVGDALYRKVSDRKLRVQLEMGGKNAVIVMDDADLEKAAESVAGGAFGATGQRCTATSRAVVVRSRLVDFTELLAAKADTWRAGDGLVDGVRLGPIVDDTQLRKVRERIEAGKKEGARIIRDGSAPSKSDLKAGYFVEPTIFADVDPNMSVAQEEIFGPVVSIIPANDFDSALAAANSVGYGLSSSIYTRDLRTAFRYAEESEAGMLHINIPTVGGEAQVPFGGIKDSGFGDRECGTAAFDFFTEQRVVYVGY